MTPPAPIAFVDTETDGLHPGCKPWEIAVIRREPDGTETEWHTFVEIDLSTADPFGLRVGRFYDRHPLGRRISGDNDLPQPYRENILALHHAAMTVAQLTHGAHIVGAVPSYDTGVLDRLLRAHGLIPAWHYHLIDVANLAVGYLAAKGIPVTLPYKSDDLVLALGLDPTPEDERHTALGDARWTMRMFDAVMSGNALHYAVTEVAGK